MSFERAQIVRSLAGHDCGTLLCIVRVEGDSVWVADGKRRRVEAPKRKNVKHVTPVGNTHPLMERIRAGAPLRNRALREALAAVRDEMEV